MNVIIQTILGISDISSLVGFWRIKKLGNGILVVITAYIFLFGPMILTASLGIGNDNVDSLILSVLLGFIGMVGFRMYFLYFWTIKYNAQSLDTINSDNP